MDLTRLNSGTQAGGWKSLRMAAVAVMLTIGQAEAQDCDARWPQLQFARDDLQRAASEGDLASALDYADRALRRFNNLAAQSARCNCPSAAAKFEQAAVGLHLAQNAESRKELREATTAAKAMFEEAKTRLQDCKKP